MNSQSNYLLQSPKASLQISALDTKNLQQHSLNFSLVIPTFNEGQNIRQIVIILSELLDDAIPGAYELIVVDDDSPDRTWELPCQLMPNYPQLKVMRREKERGLSTAVIRSWQAARGEIYRCRFATSARNFIATMARDGKRR